MYLAGEQLFNDGDLKDWLDARLNEAIAYAEGFTAENFAAYSDMALESAVISRYRVPEVLLMVDKAYFIEESELTVAEANLPLEGQPVGGNPLAPDTKLKSITIAIPFQGPHQLLSMRPNVFSVHQAEGEIRGQEVVVNFVVPIVREDFVEHRFQQHIALIERTLEVTQWQAMDFNTELPLKLRPILRARRAALAGAKA
jgi:hypothetical protein